jgi:serine beta-lactamase-like protein LACTB, mitochondrial
MPISKPVALKAVICVSLLPLLCTTQAPVHAEDRPPQFLAPEKAEAVDRAMAEVLETQRGVGLAVGIVDEGRIVYLKGYGFADRENQRPATAEAVFNWASNSKPLAAVAAMQLVQQGKLDLDADVRAYVPEFPDKGVVITPRHVLCHQSGLPHYSNGEVIPTERRYDVPNPFLDPVCACDRFNRSPLLFSPGERTEYSTYAYILLSAVIQRAGGEPFANQVQSRIAKPLGMTSLELDLENTQPGWAVGYTKSKDEIVRAGEEAHAWKAGGGGFKSNIGDFARFAEGLINGRLVSSATQAKMWEVQRNSSGKATGWGLGFTVEDERGGLKVSHNGKQDETTTRLVIYPGTKRGAVVMSNCSYTAIGEFTTAAFRALEAE